MHQRFVLPVFVLALFLLPFSQVVAKEARTLGWDDLVPLIAYPQNPLTDLTEEQRGGVEFIADIRFMVAQGQFDAESQAYKDAQEEEKNLTAQGLDVDALVGKYEKMRAEVRRINGSVVKELGGQKVRIPGYALPLEYSGEAVKEFLLVPYVGACIHTPPPPSNQMVFVTAEKPFVVDDLYMPVWVTGEMTVQGVSKNLSLVDGESEVEAGYTLSGTRIEPYITPR